MLRKYLPGVKRYHCTYVLFLMLSKSLGNFLEVAPYLNLYGLTPYQFRLFAHIARRNQKDYCTSSLEKIAIVCRMGERTARDAMSELLRNGMIQKKARYNESNLLRVIHDVTQWVTPKEPWQDKKLLTVDLLGDRTRALAQFISQQQDLLQNLKKTKRSIFVHGYLDLYGLDPYEFRVLAHIACEGNSPGSVETIAAICMMSPRKVQTTLKRLMERGLIRRHEQKGRPNTYDIQTRKDWQPPVQEWENKRTVARLKKSAEKNVEQEDGISPLENYQNNLEKYHQQLSDEFTRVVTVMEQEEAQKKPSEAALARVYRKSWQRLKNRWNISNGCAARLRSG